MRFFTIRGVDATYDETDGWRCNDEMAERLLRAKCTPASKTEADALAAARTEYGEAVEDLGTAPEPELSYTQQLAKAAQESAPAAPASSAPVVPPVPPAVAAVASDEASS